MAQVTLDLSLATGSSIPPEIVVETGSFTFNSAPSGQALIAQNAVSSSFSLLNQSPTVNTTFTIYHRDASSSAKYIAYEFRRADANNNLRVVMDLLAFSISVQKKESGQSTQVLYSTTKSPVMDVEITVTATGDQIELFVNGVSEFQTTESFNETVSGELFLMPDGFYGFPSLSYNNVESVSNAKPVALLGDNQIITTGQVFTANASGSSDGDDDTLTYLTTLDAPAGSSSTLSDSTTTTPSFTPDIDGEYTLTLVVNDGTEDSDPDSQVLTSSTPAGETADAGSDSVQYVGSPFNLDGSGSTGASSYAWSVLSKPTGSTATIVNPSSEIASFTPDIVGLYEFQLLVDGYTADTVYVRARTVIQPQTPTTSISVNGAESLGRIITLTANGEY